MTVATLDQPRSIGVAERNEEQVARRVRSILSRLAPARMLADRRRDQRYPYPQLVRLTPVAADGFTPIGETIVVIGKHLSEHGLDFFHQEPLPYRRMIATLEAPSGERASLLIDLSWCRFTGGGWYDHGGRFLHVAPLRGDGNDNQGANGES